jgi:hypothetical protein
MKLAALALLLVLPSAALAERDAVPAPDNWRRETFTFPLAFAPAIGLEGHEHVRFAPGWADFAGERGFSYVFLWDVKEVAGPALTVVGLEFALRVYFDGLMATAAKARRTDAQGAPTIVDLHPMSDEPGWTESHAGHIFTWNGFAKGEPLALEVEVTRRSCPGGQAQVFYAISRAKRSAPSWADLRKSRQGVSCGAT